MSESRQRPADEKRPAEEEGPADEKHPAYEEGPAGEEAVDPDAETTADSDETLAREVVVSYPADLSGWGRYQVEKPSFRAYLRKTRGRAAPGDRWEEFVGVGCCGNTLDVPLRVERVEGGDRLGEDTEFVFEVREACDLDGGWRVQSAGGPNGG